MDIEGPINKLVVIIIISAVFPLTLSSLNAMNVTGFTPVELAISGIFGIVVSVVFLKMIMKE